MARSEGVTGDATDTRDDDLVGRVVGKYTLARLIGRGGMGVVYEAVNNVIGKRVAVKLVTAELARNKDAVRRFQREAQAASSAESSHIVDIFDAGTSDEGMPFLVMELLRGEDLGHRIKRLGRLELDEAMHVTAQILRGLTRAHAAGIVHRDLKPDNIFLVDREDDSTFVKILDFGISKVARTGETPVQTLTKQGTVLGTPFYMSPEQAQGLPDTDARADLWSVGAILYECLTGRAPHTGASYEQVIVNICTKDAADVRLHNPGVPEGVAKVLAKALARERGDRYATARDMLEGLAEVSEGLIAPPRNSDEPGAQGVRSGPRSASSSGPRARLSSSSGKIASGPANAVSGSVSSGSASGAPRPGGAAFEDTVELRGGGPSRVGWSTSGGSAVRRDRKILVFAGAGVIALAAVGALVLGSRPGADGPVTEVPSADDDVTVRLRANVAGARFLAGGKQIVGGLLRGPRGSTRTVIVEADGYVPLEAVVALEPGHDLPELVLRPVPPDPPEVAQVPAGQVIPPAGAPPPSPLNTAMDSAVPRGGVNRGGKPGPGSPTKQTPTAPAPPPVSSAPPAPTPAPTPTLTLKLE